MDKSKYTTRSALLKQKKTGLSEEVGPAKQRLFDVGHAAEAAALPIAEEIAGVEFYPAVGIADIDGLPLLASFDGVDMLEEVIWENKLLNASLVEQVARGELDVHYWAQLEHQMLVSGASKALFTTSDGTRDGTHGLWYASVPARRAQIIAAWKQFAIDLENFVPSEPVAEVVGRTPETLPALHIVLKGEVSASNLAEFKDVALAAIRSVNRDLKTDQDFADSAKARQWCADIESRVAAAKEHALSQTQTIDMLFRTMDEVSAEARDVRLALEKLEKARKESRRSEIVAGGVTALADHMTALNTRLGRSYMPATSVDFGGAIKGLRTFDSMQNAVDTALANAKIAANETADRIQLNLGVLRELAGNHAFLFSDIAPLVLKHPEDLRAIVVSRIAEHTANEAAKAEALRARIAEEERVKAEATARAELDRQRLADKQTADEAAAVQRRAADAASLAATPAPAPVVVAAPSVVQMTLRPAPPAAAPLSPANLKLGTLNERIAPLSISAAGLSALGFEPAARIGAHGVYHEQQYPRMLAAIVRHVEAISAQRAA